MRKFEYGIGLLENERFLKQSCLDYRMKVLFKKIEDYWLGGFKVSCVYIFIYLSILLFQKKKGTPT